MKNIAIDISHYDKLSWYGLVTRNIVDRLISQYPDNKYILISPILQDINHLLKYKNVTYIQPKQNYFWYKFFGLPKILKDNHIDTFFSLDQTLPFRKVCKYIIIEHDIWFQRMGKWAIIRQFFKRWSNKQLLLYYFFDSIEWHALKIADSIISPSYFTKHDIIDYYHIPESKIHVTYWWMDHITLWNLETKSWKYILFPFCNDTHLGFVYNLAEVLIKNKIIDEVIFLKGKKKKSENPKIKIISKYISPEDKEKYFHDAKLIIYYSEYDGFGFIPLEAMIHQKPIIINKSSSLQEISGKWAITIDNTDTNKWISIIQELFHNKQKHDVLIRHGQELLSNYHWDSTVKKIEKLL